MFLDLNVDCQLLILENVCMRGLIAVAKINKHFHSLAADVVRRQCAKKSVKITLQRPQTLTSTECQQQQIIETEDEIRIKDLELAASVLQLFGSSIKSLKILQHFTSNNNFDWFYELVILHCSGSLTEIDIDTEVNDVFEKFTTPFENVLRVTLNGDFNRLSNAALNFSSIFPAIRQLVLKIVSVVDMEWMSQSIPTLEHLDVNVWTYSLASGEFSEDLIKPVFQSNPHLKSVTLRSISPSMLQFVAEQLPNLDSLELVNYQESRLEDDGSHFHFEHLKRFVMIRGAYSVPIRITFGNKSLVEFETDANPEKCKRWIKLIENEANLKRVIIRAFLEEEDFERLANFQSNMEAISVFLDNVECEQIGKFIENNQCLREIQLKTLKRQSMVPIVHFLEERFDTEWIIRHDGNKASLMR